VVVSVVDLRDARPGDLAAIASLHLEAFPDSALGRLGVEAVRRNYEWQMEGPHDLTALVALDGGRVVGFLFGGVFRGSTIGFVKRHKWYLAGQVARHPSLLTRRLGWDRIGLAARLLARRWSTPAPEDPAAVPRRSFGVLAIAVDPATQGRGVGRLLMDAAVERARAGGFRAMHLTVHPDNARGVAFYRSLGWVELPGDDGTWSGRMTYDLQADPADPAT
jgi:ribosomal protein S18 acetylase RimI-like enzyme